jgi:hypothetical protein
MLLSGSGIPIQAFWKTNHGQPYKPTKPTNSPRQHNNRISIKHTSNKEATKYLGCWKAPHGQRQQKEALAKNAMSMPV